MKANADKTHDVKQSKAVKAAAIQKSSDENGPQMADNREVSAPQTALQMMIDHSPRMNVQQRWIKCSFDTPVQRQGPEEDEEPMQGKFAAQCAEIEDEELLQVNLKRFNIRLTRKRNCCKAHSKLFSGMGRKKRKSRCRASSSPADGENYPV